MLGGLSVSRDGQRFDWKSKRRQEKKAQSFEAKRRRRKIERGEKHESI